MKKRRIFEQDYGDYPERMNPEIERELQRGETPYSKHPAMPEGESSYDVIASSKRFKDVVDKFLQYGGNRRMISNAPTGMVLQNLMGQAMQIMSQVSRAEIENREELEQLAIKLVSEEFGIPEGTINYVAELRRGGIGKHKDQISTPKQFSDEEIKDAFKGHEEEMIEFQDAFEKFNSEKLKRKFINSLVQGSAKKGSYLFNLAQEELENIESGLTQKYGLMQASMDYCYWLFPKSMIDSFAQGGGQLGQCSSDYSTDPPTITAKAGTFPLLVHELYKCTTNMLFSHGLPNDPRQREMVVQQTDTLIGEIWDTRLGPIFWEKFLEAHPEQLFDEDKKMLRNHLTMELGLLSTNEFFKVFKSILAGENYGKKYIQDLADRISEQLRKAELGGEYSDDEDGNDGDDGPDLDDLLGGLNIKKPD